MTPFHLDHLAVVAADLDTGARWIERRLGVRPEGGGRHPAMGTWNRLLSLGDDCYLEVIAVDPGASPPGRPRWFGLDRISGPPRLAAWVAACDDLDAALAADPPGAGPALSLSRGDLRWRMAVPEDGGPALAGAAPLLIEWQGRRPHSDLPRHGLTLRHLTVTHPRAAEIAHAFPIAGKVTYETGPAGLRAEIETPAGPVTL